jgi:hypothetical protein
VPYKQAESTKDNPDLATESSVFGNRYYNWMHFSPLVNCDKKSVGINFAREALAVVPQAGHELCHQRHLVISEKDFSHIHPFLCLALRL